MPTQEEKEFDLIADLKKAIQGSGYSLSKLGRMSDLNAAQLTRFVNGERGLNINAVAKLCRALRLRLVSEGPPAGRGRRRKRD